MAGTKHFTRMDYHVTRGLREIVAPIQTMPKQVWDELKARFKCRCAYCGEEASKENRGIVADHIVPVTDYGELVLGNVIPACQTCNDSRGNKCWRGYVSDKFPEVAKKRISEIEKYLEDFNYTAPTPNTALSKDQHELYLKLRKDWEELNAKAKELYETIHKSR